MAGFGPDAEQPVTDWLRVNEEEGLGREAGVRR
jgi:hypothetical protein